MKKLTAAIKTETLLFVRDFFGFFFTFAFPVLMLLLFGSIYGNDPSPYFNGQGSMDVSVPGYSAMIIGVTGLMAFPLTISGYKESGIYKRFDASPCGKGLIITAQIIVNFIMTLAGFCLLFVVGKLFFHIRVGGSATAIAFSLLLSMGAIFSLGFFFTAIAPTEKICSLFCYVSYFVMIFLSGSTMPRMMLPEGIQRFSRILPLTHAVDVLQGAFLGAPFSEYQTSVWFLLALMICCVTAGGLFYKKGGAI